MGRSQHLLCATFLFGLLFSKGIAAASITVKQHKNNIVLYCKEDNNHPISWKKDGNALNHGNTSLSLGAILDDPRGVFECNDARLQVFVRMCQNCIRLDLAAIMGILTASIVATLFMAVGVYYIAAGEPGRRSQASDKQTLLANEQLYQPLGERNNGQYSHIGVAKTRHQ
ncbi:T-cell surface glycoprotein CD3 gamma chain-like [Zootoca vivipara]|uniref:T-cell surface glycoprotein CD3 gamma chain-like n=1 Tax=Zootoca vivipara TaxID=8524 RepID=UPI00159217B7|nr:T-cell surface glycoprotein CD3 gamma chain-like [Zootoca vivipara]